MIINRTRRVTVATIACTVAVVGLFWASLASQAPRPDTARFLPAGAQLVLQAKDFNGLLSAWNGSSAKATWLAGGNYQVFSRSRLFLRLHDAYDEFSTAAGVAPDMALLSAVAGDESALAMYDIGKLEFLYVTRLPEARAVNSALWRRRGNYETRQAAGTPFYVRTDDSTERTVAFGVKNGYLLLATREDLLAGGLALIGGTGQAVASEGWFARAIAEAPTAGDVRLVTNLEELTDEPHFRSYWIQQNISELRGYQSAVSDLFRTANDFREERVLIRTADTPVPADSDLGNALRLVPPDAGHYQVWASPSADQAAGLVLEKIIATSRSTLIDTSRAPGVSSGDTIAGDSTNLEVRLDEEPAAPRTVSYDTAPWKALLSAEPLTTAVEVESTRVGTDGLFIHRGSVIAVARKTDWQVASAQDALTRMVDPVWTKGHLGLTWTTTRAGRFEVSALDTLDPVMVAVRGPVLLVASDAALLGAVLDRFDSPSVGMRAQFAAGFRHGAERARFRRLARVIEHQTIGGDEPAFLSENIGSLSDTMAGVDAETITVHDRGATVQQTVIYRLTP